MTSKLYAIGESILGQTIGRWTALNVIRGGRHPQIECLCQCGIKRIIRIEKLVNDKTKSCGCLRDENLTTHGRTKNSIRIQSHEYWIWNSMKQRCLNTANKQYPDYGGRGITVCDRWIEFQNFYADMGEKPKNKSLERRDNNQGYSPENCYWADRKSQNSNKRNNIYLTAKGEVFTLTEWTRKTGICHSTIVLRLKAGWPEEIAATAPKGYRYNK